MFLFNMKTVVNISEKYKSFLWLPPKTASTLLLNIFFEYFDFEHYEVDKNNILFKSNFKRQNHHFQNLFQGHENYKLICSVRNPFNKIISLFMQNKKDRSPEKFLQYFDNLISTDCSDNLLIKDLMKFQRVPDYFIRVENLYEDLIKIPFVFDSDVNKSGLLSSVCETIVNSSNYTIDMNEYFTSDMKDFVFTTYKDYFDKFNYKIDF